MCAVGLHLDCQVAQGAVIGQLLWVMGVGVGMWGWGRGHSVLVGKKGNTCIQCTQCRATPWGCALGGIWAHEGWWWWAVAGACVHVDSQVAQGAVIGKLLRVLGGGGLRGAKSIAREGIHVRAMHWATFVGTPPLKSGSGG